MTKENKYASANAFIFECKYASANAFMFECARLGVIPSIHWREDDLGVSGFIYFKTKQDEVHVFYSKDKKLLDAIWNSIGLVRHALKLAGEV